MSHIFESWFALTERIPSLLQKLCRMDFLVVRPSQVLSPLGALWLLRAEGPFFSCRAFCPHSVGWNEPGISTHCRVKSLWIRSQCCEVAVPPSRSLSDELCPWLGLLVPSLGPVRGDLVRGSRALLHCTTLSHHHKPRQELRAASPGVLVEAVHRACHPVFLSPH